MNTAYMQVQIAIQAEEFIKINMIGGKNRRKQKL